MIGSSTPVWPLAQEPAMWTTGGSFGAPRPSKSNHTRQHEGIDLYAPEGTPVIATEDGVVTGDQGWSGSGTRAVWVESPATGVAILYGAVAPGSYPPKGTTVKRGQQIGTVGKYPGGSTMLHFETWTETNIPRQAWSRGAAQPSKLVDPTAYLKRAMGAGANDKGQSSSSSPKRSGGAGIAVAVVGLGALLFLASRPGGRGRVRVGM